MNRFKKILILFWEILISISTSAQDTILCDSPYAQFLDLRPLVLLSPNYGGKEPIMDDSRSVIIDSLYHDFNHENYIILQVDSCREGMIYVQPMWSLGEIFAASKGWVALSDKIITYSSSDILPLFLFPSCDSLFVKAHVYPGKSLPIIDFYEGWVYTTVQDISGGKLSGWVPRLYQCPNVYTTCN